ncbi:magnesium transporter [Parvularcula bermudensis HTCC2503]|uniref:Magnesium transporter MgtE n=1 Tax=Parvularcula bermudensis (strain ATCC BAA-594 / HTCC2503 / KCTC 12087) TaxID=314260 RepID=E0TDV0_PARBH|nr:magnesium transporter [Parvularcula bermudensis]ADM10399.1 magnesium transporter [Parvularcula bermudensis HTCC2503]
MVPEISEGQFTDDTVDANDAALDERMSLTAEFVRSVDESLLDEDNEKTRGLCEELRPADMADLLEQLPEGRRYHLVEVLGPQLAPETLAELAEEVRDEIIEAMPNAQIAEAVAELDTDEAAFVVQDMDDADREEVLAALDLADRLALQASLDYPDESAGRLMQREVFAAPSFSTVGQIIDRLRSGGRLPDLFYEVFVVDPGYKVLGSVPLSRFLKAPRDTRLTDLMADDLVRVPVLMDQEEVAYLFEKYNLISAPVVDESDRLVGMMTVDDVVEVVRTEADEDLLALGGVDREESGLSVPVPKIARSRFIWLAVNLGTAILASFVISFFDATIEQVVALAVLMPIVASMGGNAGTQTLTVAVRNLATRDLTGANTFRVVGRETAVSLINGAAFAVLLGVTAGIWYEAIGGGGPGEGVILGAVLAAAMVVTMLSAGLAGILVPVTLQRFGADPAVSSAVFVTTVTDVVGFFAFLGLAAIFLVG